MKNEDSHRYEGEPLRFYDFTKEILVVCPKCDKAAKVDIPWPLKQSEAKLTCLHCHWRETMEDRKRYRISSKAICRECRTPLISDVQERKRIPSFVRVVCHKCHTENRISENWEDYTLKYNESGIIDPAFGLPLYFQDEVRGNVIWALNREHLMEIRNYVAAKLRERTTTRFNMTMVERLPEFIKLAANRQAVLDALDRMLQG